MFSMWVSITLFHNLHIYSSTAGKQCPSSSDSKSAYRCGYVLLLVPVMCWDSNPNFKTSTSWTFFKEFKGVTNLGFSSIFSKLQRLWPLGSCAPQLCHYFLFQYQAQQQQEIADYENNRILYCSNHTGENSFGSVAARMAFVMSDWVRILSRR